MRVPFDAMFQWWSKSNGHTPPRNEAAVGDDEHPASRSGEPAEPRWYRQLDLADIPRSLRYPRTTLGRILDQAAERYGDLTSIVYEDQRWTYRELLAKVNRMAGGLARLGVKRGDHVVMALPNCPEYVLSFFAVQKLGAVAVNASPLMGVDDLGTLLEWTSPRAVIGLDLQAAQLVHAAGSRRPPEHFIWVSLQSYQTLVRRLGYKMKLWHGREQIDTSIKHTTLAKLMDNAPARPPTVEPSFEANAVLQPTSGTTGALKLAQLTHRNLLANAMQVSVYMRVRPGQERVLAVLPMFHAYGLTMGLISAVYGAGTMILQTRFDASRTLDLMIREQPTVFPMVPAIAEMLSEEIERRDPQPTIRPPRACISGAAPLSRETAARFERLTGCRVVEGYGLSESSPVTHANPMFSPRYGTIGLPIPDTHCRIADLDDPSRDIPHGEPGELLISGPQVMNGYYRNPEETAQAIWADDTGRSWLRTGDIARMDDDGFFQILDRKKDMIIHSGLKVYPAKVEKVLRQHEQVVDVAVIGRPHAVHTENVVAFVVVKTPALDRAALAGELRAFCRQHLAPYEVPAKFEFTERIPRSALGKVLKKELRLLPPTADTTTPNNPTPTRGPGKEAA